MPVSVVDFYGLAEVKEGINRTLQRFSGFFYGWGIVAIVVAVAGGVGRDAVITVGVEVSAIVTRNKDIAVDAVGIDARNHTVDAARIGARDHEICAVRLRRAEIAVGADVFDIAIAFTGDAFYCNIAIYAFCAGAGHITKHTFGAGASYIAKHAFGTSVSHIAKHAFGASASHITKHAFDANPNHLRIQAKAKRLKASKVIIAAIYIAKNTVEFCAGVGSHAKHTIELFAGVGGHTKHTVELFAGVGGHAKHTIELFAGVGGHAKHTVELFAGFQVVAVAVTIATFYSGIAIVTVAAGDAIGAVHPAVFASAAVYPAGNAVGAGSA